MHLLAIFPQVGRGGFMNISVATGVAVVIQKVQLEFPLWFLEKFSKFFIWKISQFLFIHYFLHSDLILNCQFIFSEFLFSERIWFLKSLLSLSTLGFYKDDQIFLRILPYFQISKSMFLFLNIPLLFSSGGQFGVFILPAI